MFMYFKDVGKHCCADVIKTGGWNTGDDEPGSGEEK